MFNSWKNNLALFRRMAVAILAEMAVICATRPGLLRCSESGITVTREPGQWGKFTYLSFRIDRFEAPHQSHDFLTRIAGSDRMLRAASFPRGIFRAAALSGHFPSVPRLFTPIRLRGDSR
jgi:hypothetical protein